MRKLYKKLSICLMLFYLLYKLNCKRTTTHLCLFYNKSNNNNTINETLYFFHYALNVLLWNRPSS